MPTTRRTGKPSPKQLAYLRSLAAKTGTSFTYPRTSAAAGREIERLLARKPESREDIDRQRREIADDMATKRGDEAQVQESELTGYGSSATWADPRRLANNPQCDDRERSARRSRDGKPHELLGYTAGGQHRLIVVQRINGLIRVEDHPSPDAGTSKVYLVADGLKTCGQLDCLIADYQAQAARQGAIPAQVQGIEALIDLAI